MMKSIGWHELIVDTSCSAFHHWSQRNGILESDSFFTLYSRRTDCAVEARKKKNRFAQGFARGSFL